MEAVNEFIGGNTSRHRGNCSTRKRSMKQAVILAGGKGTRLRSVLADVPKPLAEVNGESLLGHQLKLLKKHDFTEVLILVNHGADAIEEWLLNWTNPGISVRLLDDGTARGTAGAVLAALPLLASKFLVLYADTMIGIDLSRFWNWHLAAPDAAASIFIHPNDHPMDSDLVEVDADGKVLAFHPYPHQDGVWLPNLVNAALYIMNRTSLIPWAAEKQPLDFGKDLFPRMIAQGQILRGYNSPEYIKDAGTPSRLERVRRDFNSGAVRRASLDQPQRAVFIDRDGTINKEVGHISQPHDLHVFPFVGSALKRLNENEWRTVIITNQPVIARGNATQDEMRKINARLDSEVAHKNAYFDRLYLCPHHPDKGFPGEIHELKIPCSCRKPAPGLIFKAQADLNIDLAKSWLIGDSTADLGAAEAAGVSSILVRTGYGGLDERHPFEPGFMQPDFAAAVDFILDIYPKVSARCRLILNKIGETKDIFIGGLSRSGKSTIASTVARELRQQKKQVVVISLDRWILGLADRGSGVFSRYDVEGILKTIRRASQRHSGRSTRLSLPFYYKKSRRSVSDVTEIAIDQNTIIIWEGVVALGIVAQLDLNHLSVAVHSEESARYLRYREHDKSRGLNEAVSAQNWQERESDEHPIIRRTLKGAHHEISLDNLLATKTLGEFQ
jgi:D,D-heptose 1,7-bisphosphate phosphatase